MADENGRAGRERTRRRRSSGLIVFLTILFIAVIGIVGAAIFFRVSEVEIEGESRYTDEQIISASGKLFRTFDIAPGESVETTVGPGIFIVNKKKVSVK